MTMPVTININGLSLVHRASAGTAMATLPDVCKTPSSAGPVPVPYPNIAMSKDLMKGTTSVFADGGNMAAHQASEIAISTGDEAGSAGGVVSSTFMKEATWIMYSFDVKLEGQGACRLTDKLFMNHMNTVCMGGWIQEWLKKNRGKSLDDACKALFEHIMDLVDGGGRQGEGRGLDGPDGRFQQNTSGGGLGPQGAPNAPRNHGPVEGYPQGANDWETHDNEIRKQQNDLKKKLKELDDECGGGSRRQQKDLKHAREVAERERPKKEEWTGPQWEPETSPVFSLSPETVGKILIVGGIVLIVGGVAAAIYTGGTSLTLTKAGVAILAGGVGVEAATATTPDGA
jgi:Domain of unknown function (DUF4150)